MFLTDSLGCPRGEISVTDTWTDRILSKWSNEKIQFYTYCEHGLAASYIDMDYVREIAPDFIIMQIGIVDACRRSLSLEELKFIKHLPVVSKIIKKICNRYHYEITKIRDIHYCPIGKFDNIIRKIHEDTGAKISFISIAPAGKGLIKKVYNIQNDIDSYNSVVKSISSIMYINPYEENVDDFILSDGHHLNLRGQEMVFSAVDKVIEKFFKEVENV